VGPGDEVLLPSYVCSAPLHAIYHTGATPVLVDVDPITGNMDPADLRNRLTSKSKVIIAVHLFGLPAAIEDILAPGLPVIEDCAQALGGALEGRQLGTFGEATVCSFYATKLMSTGEGGMVLSADHGRLERIRDLKDYDKRDDFALRFNYKMTDLQGALGRCQLKKLTTFLQQRKVLAVVYAECLASLPCTLPQPSPARVYYRYVISVDQDIPALIQALADQGVEATRPVYTPLHRYLNLPGYPGADRAWQTHLSLPIHPSLSAEDVELICQVLQQNIKG
jgi:dTDP-4-amino-4,6-dideoxygalactose transaminase